MTNVKEINFDLDGTLVDLYGVDGWLDYILAKDAKPYEVAKPLVNFSALARILNRKQAQGYKIRVISWLAKGSDTEYDERVKTAKLNYLKNHLASVHFDDIQIVAYGTPKSTCGNGILFDDEKPNRDEWKGTAYDVDNILEVLKSLA